MQKEGGLKRVHKRALTPLSVPLSVYCSLLLLLSADPPSFPFCFYLHIDQKNKIKSLEEEIQGKVEAQRSYAEEKALIRSKIDGLLVKLDDVSKG